MVPPSQDVGLAQEPTTDPEATPGGTRPEAMPPATAPRKKGVSTEAAANTQPSALLEAGSCTALRKAKAEPRRMTPTATAVRGTYMVEAMEAKAEGKPVHRTTRAKISHTWLASHTGPMECSILARMRSPLADRPALRSQKPAPKSAPPSRA